VLASPVWRASNRQGFILTLFAAGLIAGGLTTATGAWLVSGLFQPLPLTVRSMALFVLAVVAALQDLGWIHLALPQASRQIPQTLFRRGLVSAALQFGFELGTGLRTYLPSALPYLLLSAVILLGQNPWLAAAAGAGFGLGRAMMPLVWHASKNAEWWDKQLTLRSRYLALTSAFAGIACMATVVASAMEW
jgi:hypothetical protein